MSSPVWHPFTQHGLSEPIPLVERAEGAALFTADGRRIIDAISSWWVTTHGHRHPAIMQAIAEQSERLDQIIFAGWTHEPAERLARELLEDHAAASSRYVFYSDSGSTSVEVALKMALGYWRISASQDTASSSLRAAIMAIRSAACRSARAAFSTALMRRCCSMSTSFLFLFEGREQATLDALEKLCRTLRLQR